MTAFAAIDEELARWREAGLVPRFWLRDDDAIAPSAALDRLIALACRHEAPVLLAVIPAGATPALVDRLADEPLVTPCQHGIAHADHAAEGERSVELGGGRPAADILADLAAARQSMRDLFGDRLSGILVPPWNRMSPQVARGLDRLGFSGLSTWSWQRQGTRLPELNTHVDVMDWQERRGRDVARVTEEMLRRLAEARARGGAPLGILMHHLVHDEQAWTTLETLLGWLAGERGLAFASADALLASVPVADAMQGD